MTNEVQAGEEADYVCTTMDTLRGGSGGPVFAIEEADGTGPFLAFLGVASAAAFSSDIAECGESVVVDQCSLDTQGLNVISLSPFAK